MALQAAKPEDLTSYRVDSGARSRVSLSGMHGSPDDGPAGRAPLEGWAAEQRQQLDTRESRLRADARAARDWLRKIVYLRARWPRPLGTRPPVNLAVCAIFRD